MTHIPLQTRWKDDGMMLIRVMSPNSLKKQFLDDELFSMTLHATLQRSPTYKKDITNKKKMEFQQGLRRRLEHYAAQYKKSVNEDNHINNIEMLSNEVSDAFGEYLNDGRFRIGGAQKALNLYLKYLWIVGKIDMPPHCPLDSIVINKLHPSLRKQWTKLTKIEEYKSLITELKKVANGEYLALWELRLYNKVRHEELL